MDEYLWPKALMCTAYEKLNRVPATPFVMYFFIKIKIQEACISQNQGIKK